VRLAPRCGSLGTKPVGGAEKNTGMVDRLVRGGWSSQPSGSAVGLHRPMLALPAPEMIAGGVGEGRLTTSTRTMDGISGTSATTDRTAIVSSFMRRLRIWQVRPRGQLQTSGRVAGACQDKRTGKDNQASRSHSPLHLAPHRHVQATSGITVPE